ncbi:alpha-hydroxy acid oxidase [Gluconobacter oxydans]|uniref:alpha-hydroxy acid oxidase n=1 Tax=Gluconobacter oxydans TaxID=442 RepID=UPI0039E9FFD4
MNHHGIAALHRRADRVLPRIFRDYVNGGSHSERTVRANRRAFDRWAVVPKCLVDVSDCDLSGSFLGATHRLPFMFAPLGFGGLMCPDGEIRAARIAASAGLPMAVSTFAIQSLETLSRVPGVTLAAQIYVFRDRGITRDMLRRAESCGIRNIILTVDTPITPLRLRDVRNGFRNLTRPSLRHVLSMAVHPRWTAGMLRSGMPKIGNLAPYGMGSNLMEQARNAASQIDPTLTWKDLDWLRSVWPGQLAVKGIMDAGDALACQKAGAQTVIVSNHGGRQMDPAPSSLSVLPDIVEALKGETDVILDGGVRWGGDVVTALALGAKAVGIGRPWAWALAAGGERGVRSLVDGLGGEIRDVLRLGGMVDLASLRAQGAAALRPVR